MTGIYFYERTVYDIIRSQALHSRVETTVVSDAYLAREDLHSDVQERWWTDESRGESDHFRK